MVRDGTLNEAALRELFSVMQAVSDRYGLGEKANDGGIAFMVTSNASTGLGMSADVPQGVMEYSYGRANAALFTLKDVLGAYMSDDGQAALTPAPGMEQGVYTPRVLAGITAQSAQQEAGCTVHTGAARARRARLFVGRGLRCCAPAWKQVAYVQGSIQENAASSKLDVRVGLDTAVEAEDTRAGRQHGGQLYAWLGAVQR